MKNMPSSVIINYIQRSSSSEVEFSSFCLFMFGAESFDYMKNIM